MLKSSINIYASHYLVAIILGFSSGIFLSNFGREDWNVWLWLLCLIIIINIYFWKNINIRLSALWFIFILLGYWYYKLLLDNQLINLSTGGIIYLFSNIKITFISSLQQILPEPQASLGAGLIIGGNNLFSYDLKQMFINTGTIHIVAVSGFNITIMLKIFSQWFRFLGRWVEFIIGTLIIIGFIILVGGQASVVRAGIMGWLFLLARVNFRLANIRNGLFITGFFMLLQEPSILIKDIGFQLSFIAMLGLIYISPIIAILFTKLKRLNFLPNFIKLALQETLAAQIAVALIIAGHFGRLSLIAPIPNMLIVPILFAPMLMSLLIGLLAIAIHTTAIFFSIPLLYLLTYILKVIELSNKIPYASVSFEKLNWWWVGVGYGLIIFILYYIYHNAKIKFNPA